MSGIEETLVLRTQDTRGVVTLTLNRPQTFNALSEAMLAQLQHEFDAIASDESVRAVVIAAEGKAFCAGHDLKEMRAGPSNEYYERLFAQCSDVMLTIQRLAVPVIARVQGIATAAGCQLVAMCDLAVAASTARFAVSGVNVGLFCSTPLVPVSRAVGHKRAMQMLLTGEPVPAAQAVEWGLINQAVPAAELEAAVEELAGKILQYSSKTIATGKQAYYAQADLPEGAAYEVTEPIMSADAAGEDAQEGMSAFLEKRQPVWSDRRP